VPAPNDRPAQGWACDAASGVFFEASFQGGQVGGHLLGGFASHHQWDEDFADAVAGEVDADGQLRPVGGQRLHGEVDDDAD
jgi:hypothetical protein